ncbi:MAG: hypothetical protein ABSD85_01830 [Acidimicrobiales bacterium]
MNRPWHEQHRLEKGSSIDARVQWHLEHAEACGCRPVPPPVLDEMERRGLVPQQSD